LCGQGYRFLAEGDSNIEEGEFLGYDPSAKGKYYKFIKDVINSLIKIPSEQVWVDFSFTDSKKLILDQWSSTDWFDQTPWKSYFRTEEFDKLVKVFDEEYANPTVSINQVPYKNVFREKGSLIAYFMLKTLLTELPLTKKVFTTAPAQINFPYETFFIYTDVIQPQLFNDTEMKLLEIIHANLESNKNDVIGWEPRNRNYKPCIKGMISHLHIHFASTDGRNIPFMLGPVIVQLHFIQHSDP
jgi:hypothetical protein